MSLVKRSSGSPRFLQFTLRGIFLLVTVIGVFAAVIAWQARPSLDELKRQAANERLLAAVERRDANAAEADAAGADELTRSIGMATAFRNDDVPIARLLLEAGVDFSMITPPGTSSIRICVEAGRIEMLELLLSYRAQVTPGDLLSAVEGEHSADLESRMIDLLLSDGVDIEAALNSIAVREDWAYDGTRARLDEKRMHRVRVAEKLRLYGATFTPRIAAELGLLNELSDFLAEDPSIVRNRYTTEFAKHGHGDGTLLGIALERADRRMAKMLLEAGAPVDLRFGSGTLLMAATVGGDPELVKLLIDLGVDPNDDKQSFSPLYVAIIDFNSDDAAVLAALLIESGADVNALSNPGTTPLIEAVRHNHGRVVELLLAAGADASMTGPDGLTPYEYAQAGNNSEIVELLK